MEVDDVGISEMGISEMGNDKMGRHLPWGLSYGYLQENMGMRNPGNEATVGNQC